MIKKQIKYLTIILIIVTMLIYCKKDIEIDNISVKTVSVKGIAKTFALCMVFINNKYDKLLKIGIRWKSYDSQLWTYKSSVVGERISFATGFTLHDLKQDMSYFVQAYATDTFDTIYGNILSFKTQSENWIVTDFDGNIYHPVEIGDQVWLKENLKTTHYNNGDPIPYIKSDGDWENLSSGAYCYNAFDSTLASTYGCLYNLQAIIDNRNISPVGWHIPSDQEWNRLFYYLGGIGLAGGKLKEKDTTHWSSPNTGATDQVGFTALPGGSQYKYGFTPVGNTGYWWASSYIKQNFENITFENAGIIILNFDSDNINNDSFGNNTSAYSVRCIMDYF